MLSAPTILLAFRKIRNAYKYQQLLHFHSSYEKGSPAVLQVTLRYFRREDCTAFVMNDLSEP